VAGRTVDVQLLLKFCMIDAACRWLLGVVQRCFLSRNHAAKWSSTTNWHARFTDVAWSVSTSQDIPTWSSLCRWRAVDDEI